MNMTKDKDSQGKTEQSLQQRPRIFHLELSVPEARHALEAFAKDRRTALAGLTQELKKTVSHALNQLMNLEVEIFLDAPGQAQNKRNGYRKRDYALKGLGNLEIRVPRDRDGQFTSAVVPSHERMDPRLRQDLAFLHLAGISNRTLAMISKRLLGIEVSKDTVSSSLETISGAAEGWLTRPLTGRYWALYVDGTNFRIQRRGTTAKEPCLIILAIDENNHRTILGVEPGQRDNAESWRVAFRELKKRGLDVEGVRIGIMDGLPGLERVFAEEFPNAVTARCWVHALRNALAKTPERLAEAFKRMSHDVMYASSENAAREAFQRLQEAFKTETPRAVSCLEKDLESLLVHYRFDNRFWIALKTTNAIERIHKEFKRRTKSMESISEVNLMTVVAFISLRLEMGWRQHRVDSRAVDKLIAPARRLNGAASNALEETIDKLSETH